MKDDEILRTGSHLAPLKIALRYKAAKVTFNDYAVLMLHGSSFPSAQSFGFRMNTYSWMDHLSENGYEVYALDFLGYGMFRREEAPKDSQTYHQQEMDKRTENN